MKFFLSFLIIGILITNNTSAKILNIENKVFLDVPSSHNFIKYDEDLVTEAFNDFLDSDKDIKIDAFLVGPLKYIELERSILNGEDLMNNKYVLSIVKKMEKKNFKDEIKAANWMILEAKKIMRKEKIDFITYVIVINKNLKDLLVLGNEVDDAVLELYSMNNSELLNKTKELKQMMSLLDGANSKTYFVGPASIEYNKLKIQKNNHGELILKGPSKVTYAVTDTLTLDVKTNILLGSHNDKMYLLISACYVDCSKFNSKFNKMIKPIFSRVEKKTNDIKISPDSNFVEQLKSLNELYKSGVLTKEEFEKAKKKILN